MTTPPTPLESVSILEIAPLPLFNNFRECQTGRQKVFAVLRAIKRFGTRIVRKTGP